MGRKLLLIIILFASPYFGDAQGDIEKMLNKADQIYAQNPAESFALCESAARQAQKDGDTQFDGDIALCRGRYYLLITKYDAATSELNKAIIIFEKKGDLQNLAVTYKLKSILLHRVGEVNAAHKILLEALEIYREIDDQDGVIGVLLNLTLDYNRFNQADSMLYCLEELETLMDDSTPSWYYHYYQNWGTYFLLIDEIDRSIQQYETALEVAEDLGMVDSKATCLMLLAGAYRTKGELQKAEELAEMSYNYSEENNLIYESYEALQEWLKVKEEQGDIRGAYEIQKKWIRVDKEINDLEKIQKASALEAQLEMVEQEKQIAEGEIALQKSNLEGQKARTRNAWLAGIILLAIVLLVYTTLIYIRTRKLNKTINEQKEEVEIKSLKLEDALGSIQDSLEYSKMIQNSMLPSKEEFDASFDGHFVLYKPKDIVSGDFYWLYRTKNKTVIAVGDCTGHGVPGAMVSMVCHEALNKVIIEQEVDDPGEILDKVRVIVANTFKQRSHNLSDGMDVGLISVTGDELRFAGANNGLWLYRAKNEIPKASESLRLKEFEELTLIELRPDKQPIGNYHAPEPFSTRHLKLHKADQIYLYSDGYADQFGGDKGKKLKASNLKEIIAKTQNLDMTNQGLHLNNLFEEWKGPLEQLDDVCIIGLKV